MATQLVTLHRQVCCFTAEVDRFGYYETFQGRVSTICFKNLRLAKTNAPVHPNHWWFNLRKEIIECHLQPGDTVLFEAKIHRCHKGYQPPANQIRKFNRRPPRTDFGPGRTIRNLTVLKRKFSLTTNDSEVEKLQARLVEEEQAKMRLIDMFNCLTTDLDQLTNQLNNEKNNAEAIQAEFDQYQQRLTSQEAQLIESNHQNQNLLATVSQLEQQLQTTIPCKKSYSILSFSIVLSLVVGVGIGQSIHRSPTR